MKRIFMLIAICSLASGMAFGQATGQLSGLVTDQTGALLPGVDVTLTQADTGAVRSAITNETGAYAFPALQPAVYVLEVSLPGFQTFRQTSVELQVGANLVIDASLQVGQVAQTIEVVANSELQVETRAMAISEVIENERIIELPLAARDVTSLLTLAGQGAWREHRRGFG